MKKSSVFQSLIAGSLAASMLLFSMCTAGAQEVKIITENAPPNSFIENGSLTGKAVEIVQAVLKEIGMGDHPILIYPWARGYSMLANKKNIMLFPTSRTPYRENRFKWAGPISDNPVHLYKLKTRSDIQPSEFEDLRKYRIGSTRNDQKSQYLLSKGFTVELVNQDRQNLGKLFLGRLDIIPYAEERLAYDMKLYGYNSSQVVKIWQLKEISTQNYVAFSKSTDDLFVKKFQEGFDAIRKKGIQERILKKWRTRLLK